MYDSNYYVAVDENGQPYIAHALFRSSASSDGGGRGRHKYLAKFEKFFDNGKTFYAYTQQQVQQAMNRGRNKAKYLQAKATVNARAAKYKAGQKVKSAREALSTTAKNIQNKAKYAKAKATVETRAAMYHLKKHANDSLATIKQKFAYGKAKTTVESRAAAYHIKKHATETLGDIKSQLNFRGKQIETRAGVAQREAGKAANKAVNKVNEAADKAQSQLNFRGKQIETRAGVAQREIGKAVNKATNNYIENSKEKKDLDDAEKNLNRAVEDYKHATNLSAAATKRLDSARDNMRDTSKALSDALDKYEKARGTDSELSAYYDYQSAKKASDKASNEYRTVLRSTVENNPRRTANVDKAAASVSEYTRQLQNARDKYNNSLVGWLDRNVNEAQYKASSGTTIIDKSKGKRRVYTIK